MTDIHLTVLSLEGDLIYRTFVGGNSYDNAEIVGQSGAVYLFGSTASNDYPVTDNSAFQGVYSAVLTKISFCPNKYDVRADTLSPKVQTACKYGLGVVIRGQDLIVPGDSLPTVYLNAAANLQPPLAGATYQWQKAIALSGPWVDIPNATARDYRPSIGAVDQYYRRQAFTSVDCGTAFIHNSDTAVVLADTLTAPTLNPGQSLVTCPNSSITIGGSPTATGGNPPYSYSWDYGLPPISNPNVNPSGNSVYTLTVEDVKGCLQLAQAVVLVYKANAGPDKSSCAGAPVRIGSAPIAGTPGIIYAWQPAIGLTSTSIAQPFANPAAETNYDLTLTVPKSGGGTCITYDTVTVTAVAAPSSPNFAGADQVICLGSVASLGATAEPGFTYSWSPGNYLTGMATATPAYYPGTPLSPMPIPNPALYNAYASRFGCIFSDNVTVATIEARAGPDKCGPAIIGLPDRTPNINETYAWVKMSGPGNFMGPVNTPQVTVSASPGVTTVYRLTVSYNGGSCSDEVTVLPVCDSSGGFFVSVFIDPPNTCPGFSANNGIITLRASSNIPNAVYSWSPQVGLNTYTGNTVQLTDTIARTYFITAVNAHDSTMSCHTSVSVNNPALVAPVFHAPDTAVCANVPVMIGLPPVNGYTYQWSGFGLNDPGLSNPIATVSQSTEFMVSVTNADGCTLVDTVLVLVQDLPADAGNDWVICNSTVINLGTSAVPNTSYLWEPQISAWQTGSSQFSAQPEVLAAANVTYVLTATSSAGCVSTVP